MSELLIGKVSALRQKHNWVHLSASLSWAIGGLLAAVLAEMLADWLWEMPWVARAAWLGGAVALGVWVALRHGLWRVLRAPDLDELALMVEQRHSDFQSRLIASLQLTRPGALPPGASTSLVRALVKETERMANGRDFAPVISSDPLTRGGSVLAVATVLFLAVLTGAGQTADDLLKRALLVPNVPVPRQTRVQSLSGDCVVAIGDSLTLKAQAGGMVIPKTGTLLIRTTSGTSQSFELRPDPANAKEFSRTLANIQESFSYSFRMHDGRSRTHQVIAKTRPTLLTMELRQRFPAYTHLPPAGKNPGDLTLLAGSRLSISLTANKPLLAGKTESSAGNRIHLVGSNQDYPLTLKIDDPKQLTISDMPLPPGTRGFSVYLLDNDGLESKDPVVYPIDLIPDQAPTIRVTSPTQKEELLTARAAVLVGFEALDDFAIGGLTLRYRIGAAKMPEMPAENVAKGTAASQSATAENGDAARAVDGNVDGEWGHNSVTHTADSDRPWWQTDLTEARDIDRIALFNRREAPERLHDFYLFVSDQPFNSADPAALLKDPKVWSHFHPGTIDQSVEIPVKRVGRYVRVQLRDRGVLSLAEVQVWGAIPAPTTQPEQAIELDTAGTPKSLRGYYKWELGKLRLVEGTQIEWWLEVRDTNDVTGPSVATSEHYLTRVASENQVRAALMQRLGNVWSPIEDVSQGQQDLNQRLGEIIQEKPQPK